jgi:hypothetical protein
MKVFLSGEGKDDIGGWATEAPFRGNPPDIGVIEALLRKVTATEITIRAACVWKKIRKYRSGHHAQRETRNVLGLVLEAEELGCDAVVFVRDRDGDPERQADIEAGVKQARAGDFAPAVVGGVAIEEIEAWILALMGEHGSEQHTDPKAVLARQHGITGCAEMVNAVQKRRLEDLPMDATSLRDWLKEATATFIVQS